MAACRFKDSRKGRQDVELDLDSEHEALPSSVPRTKYRTNGTPAEYRSNVTKADCRPSATKADCRPSSPAQDLSAHFECPVCFDFVLPPIQQCESGHLVCSECRPKLACCHSCRGPLMPIRNLAMERVAETVQFPCRYRMTGCTQTFHYSKKKEHEEVCEFRPYMCPCPGTNCKWQGGLDDVLPHLCQSHKAITTLQGEDIVFLATDIHLRGAVDWVMMQSCFEHNFMLALEKQDRVSERETDGSPLFYAVVQIIGTRQQAENFVYKLELTNPNSSKRLLWEAVPRSIQDGLAAAIAQHDCLKFDAGTAELFAEAGNLALNVTVARRQL